MNSLDKQIYRILFENKLLRSNADEFQNLFETLMKCRYEEKFCIVKPYGNIGDMKNDGFLSDSQIYFQVYGPENIADRITKAISKIKEDARGLVANWNNVKTIKYVVNDKFLGVSPNVYKLLEKLKNELEKISNSIGINIVLVLCADLENEFMKLSEEKMAIVVNFHYCTVNLDEDVDLTALKDVINYILNIDVEPEGTPLLPPNYELKIKENCFSDKVANRLKSTHINAPSIELFFSQYGETVEEEIKDRFVTIYKQMKKIVPKNKEDYGDNIYYLILNEIKPNNKIGTIVAIENLIAYYFECCDIFEAPKEDK